MAKIIYQSPRRYVQGKGVIESIAEVNEQLKNGQERFRG